MIAKRFFYVCAGLLCLAVAYHLGARSAFAISTETHWPIVGVASDGTRGHFLAIDANGDAFASSDGGKTWTLVGSAHPILEYDPKTKNLK